MSPEVVATKKSFMAIPAFIKARLIAFIAADLYDPSDSRTHIYKSI
jgi:hypothetical protein